VLDTLDCGVFAITAYVIDQGRARVFFNYGGLADQAALRQGFGSLIEAITLNP
jgi:hypothetical protein